MAKVVAIGQPVNDSEREAIAYLRDHLPDGFTVIHNFELRQGHNIFEIDIALLGPHCVYLVDVKGTRGLVDVHGSKWYPQRRAPYHSPLAILRNHAKALKSLIRDQSPTDRTLRNIHVDAAVLMTAPDAHVQDPGGLDAPSVAYLKKCTAFFKSTKRIPTGRSTDIRSRLRQIQRAIVGRATPRNAPPSYGNWQVEERLGGTDRYTEYRARHTFLGAKQDIRARLRVYPVDPYLPEPERKAERRRIENAFRAVTALPGHPNILTVRDFFANEDENQFVLVTEDVAGQALRQHIAKASLSLTFDQKIAIVRDVLAALNHAHRSEPQVVHRNLTPDAVLVGESGRALLCGFDYARRGRGEFSTIAEAIVDELNPIYQAPECDKDPSQASVASDLYAAGLVFYELLVGEPAWTSVDDMMDKDAIFPVKPSELKPELRVEFDEWLQGLCAFDAEDRPANAAIALARFNEIVGPDPREAGTPKAANSFAPTSGRPDIAYAALERGDDLANRFRIEEKLGRGGFSEVYRVFDSFSDTSRVLKLIVKDRRSTFERLKREYSILERLPPHPNVVRVVWADKLSDGTPFMVFEYVPGTGVDALLESDSFSPDDVKLLGLETLAGLVHLHENGVFHRDIKPSNLLWTDRGVRIIDFNVAVNADDDESRPGGTKRYVPPDLQVGEEMTPEEKTDWDLFALGVTLYECVTGKYPWDGPRPVAHTAPKDPRDFARDLASEFVQVLLQAIASRRTDRFASAAAFRDALSAVAAARIVPATVPVEPLPDSGSGELSLLHQTRPNVNPFVSHLLTMYSQSPRSNAGTRGLDAIGRETYIRTLLDETLRSALLAGEFRLVTVTGNAGDGKTAFIQQIENAIEEASTLERRPNGSTFSWAGRRFITNHDGSQDEDDVTNDEVLRAFFAPFEGDDSHGWPQDETRIIAINEGRLVDFLTEHENRYGRLRTIVLAGLAGAAPEDGVAAVNLNLRSVVASPPASVGPDSIFDRLLRRLTTEKYWEACAGCDLRDRCYVHHNARTLMDPIAGPKVAERLRALYTITHLRGRLHITMRDLRSALAFTLAGTRDCDQIHTLYTTSTADSRQQILNGFYFNAWQGGTESTDRLLALLGQIDVGEATNPDLDRALDYLPPGDRETARLTFAERGSYDTQLLDRRHQELPQDAMAGTTAMRMAEHREYVAMLRRRQFFERRDEHWKEMLPYPTYDEFWQLVTGHKSADLRLEKLLLAINRGEGLTDPRRLGDALALRVRVVEHGTVRSYRLFPGELFKLNLPAQAGNRFVEHVPQALRLTYTPPGGQPAELVVDLDMFEMLLRLDDGYRPSLEEQQGRYLSLAVFKNVLSSAPYQEVLLTRTGHDFYRIDRKLDGVLSLQEIDVEAV